MDKKAFRALSYGMYIITSQAEDRRAGCVVNTFNQITSAPTQVSVAVNKENATADVIRESGRFCASVLGELATMELIGRFGFRSSADTDKFADTQWEADAFGVPQVTESAVAVFSAHVVETIDAESHWLFVGAVDDCRALSAEAPMTYAYYHQVKGGKTPPKASSYIVEESAEATAKAAEATGGAPATDTTADQQPATAGTSTWRCGLCGYEITVEGDALPEGFECPICGAGPEMFERIA